MLTTKAPGRLSAILSLLLVMLVWGSTFAVTKEAIAEIPPFLLAFLRYVAACAVLVPIALARGGLSPLPRPIPWGALAWMGLLGVTVFYLGFNLALTDTSASAAALIQGATPAITAVLALPLLGEKPRSIGILGLAVSILGVALIVLASGDGDAPHPLLGDAFTVAAVAAWSLYTILAKRFAGVAPLAVTTAVSVYGLIFLAPFAAYDLIVRPPAAVSAGATLAVVYLGVAGSALAYLVWNRALAVLSASQVAAFINLVPLVGVIVAVVWLNEPVTAPQLVGGALVLIGVWLSSR